MGVSYFSFSMSFVFKMLLVLHTKEVLGLFFLRTKQNKHLSEFIKRILEKKGENVEFWLVLFGSSLDICGIMSISLCKLLVTSSVQKTSLWSLTCSGISFHVYKSNWLFNTFSVFSVCSIKYIRILSWFSAANLGSLLLFSGNILLL